MNDKIKLDEVSLEMVLNLALERVNEDREMAIRHHNTLRDEVEANGWGDQLTLQELASSLSGFLANASLSTEKLIKISKILADLLVKIDSDDTLTDADRAEIEDMVKKDNEGNVIPFDFLGDG